jgi:hypothetical protein
MWHLLKDHGPNIAQSAFDTKSLTATVLTAGSAATAITVEVNNAITLSDVSVMAAIFAGSCTGIYMFTNVILNVLKIIKEIKEKD